MCSHAIKKFEPLLVMLQKVSQAKEILQTVFSPWRSTWLKFQNLKEGTNTKQKVKASHSVKS